MLNIFSNPPSKVSELLDVERTGKGDAFWGVIRGFKYIVIDRLRWCFGLDKGWVGNFTFLPGDGHIADMGAN